MPRGSRPGERRGGRQRGTPNKKTLIKNAVFCAAAADPDRSPLDFMLALMRDPQVPLDLRLEMAAAASPFVHARPEPARNKRPDPLDLGDRLMDTGDLKFEESEAKPTAEGSGDGSGPSPLDFLLGVMKDPAATPQQRVKAAGVAARYKHAYAGGAEASTVIVGEDKFGFKVDPELARAERDDRVREAMLCTNRYKLKKGSDEEKAGDQELERIGERRAERVAPVKFPDGYAHGDREADQRRLQQLYSKRLSRKKLTPEEDAEEAHLAVRVLSPEPAPMPRQPFSEMEWPMSRMVELEERVLAGDTTPAEEDELQDLRSRNAEIAANVDRLDRYRYCFRREREKAEKAGLGWWAAYRTAQEKCWPLRDPRKMVDLRELREGPLPRIHELETLRFDEILTPEEADELEELHRHYPQRAERTRNFVVRRLSDHQANREAMRRTGSDPGPIEEDGWPRRRTPTGRMAGR
jgi:hypothetical protein